MKKNYEVIKEMLSKIKRWDVDTQVIFAEQLADVIRDTFENKSCHNCLSRLKDGECPVCDKNRMDEEIPRRF